MVIALGIGLLVYISVFLLALIIRRVLDDPRSPSHRRVFRFLAIPLALWATILSIKITVDSLGRGATAEAIGER